jgi:MoxR-like ATPase
VRGQERAKRALEIAAAGRHHLLMVGTPGSGKSMLAARLPGILPPLTATEALETSMIHSLSGLLDEGGISRERPFREPHHTASMAAIVGGGKGAKPGEISLAHNGVLFLDEFPEFPRTVLETLRQPIETGDVVVARANAHVRYPCKFMLIAAANPCKCGYLSDPARACARAPVCGEDYMGRISGPLMDRFDLRVEVPPVAFTDLELPEIGRTLRHRRRPRRRPARAQDARRHRACSTPTSWGSALDEVAAPDDEGRALLAKVAERIGLSARGYHRILRVARTIADLAGEDSSAAPTWPRRSATGSPARPSEGSRARRPPPRPRLPRLGQPVAEDLPGMGRVVPQIDRHLDPPARSRSAIRSVSSTQDLGAPAWISTGTRRGSREQRRHARIARIVGADDHLHEIPDPLGRQKRVGRRRSARRMRP